MRCIIYQYNTTTIISDLMTMRDFPQWDPLSDAYLLVAFRSGVVALFDSEATCHTRTAQTAATTFVLSTSPRCCRALPVASPSSARRQHAIQRQHKRNGRCDGDIAQRSCETQSMVRCDTMRCHSRSAPPDLLFETGASRDGGAPCGHYRAVRGLESRSCAVR